MTLSSSSSRLYCDKHHVNQLTSLMLSHGVTTIVACPGSRNAVLIHNFTQHPDFSVHHVVDERSAGFVALGMSVALDAPVAVCVTSGSALLNLLPAVCEAYYRKVSLLIISADRPMQYIDQLDGQTIHQVDALQPYAKTFQLTEMVAPEEAQYNNRIINEALNALRKFGGGPLHINLPISEPLFSFTTQSLPEEPAIFESTGFSPDVVALQDACKMLSSARLPMIVVGQMTESETAQLSAQKELFSSIPVYAEVISNFPASIHPHIFEQVLLDDSDLLPDVVVHIGGHLVNKTIKNILRNTLQLNVIRIESGTITPDTFHHLAILLRTSNSIQSLEQLAKAVKPNRKTLALQAKLLQRQSNLRPFSTDKFSDLGVMEILKPSVQSLPDVHVHLANSSAVRNANHLLWDSSFPVCCNRGTNGIEGSLSAAVGHALARPHANIVLFIGDLSFFYDNNALWNDNLRGNLRIVLFNNGGGQIFHRLPGLEKSPALTPYISGSNYASAKGLADSFRIEYHAANNFSELENVVAECFRSEADRPILLEVFTHTTDNRVDSDAVEARYRC